MEAVNMTTKKSDSILGYSNRTSKVAIPFYFVLDNAITYRYYT